jgi:hypothetical protein
MGPFPGAVPVFGDERAVFVDPRRADPGPGRA